MNLQYIVDAMGEAQKNTRSDYHLTLGELIAILENIDPDAPVKFEDGTSPDNARSYRGYYSDLAFDHTEDVRTASDVLEVATDVHGTELMGYKGGDYLMGDLTPLWKASWGDLGTPILSAKEWGGDIVLVLGEDEKW